MEIPHISSAAEDEAAVTRIDEMTEDELRSELATNQIAKNHFVDQERELSAALTRNKTTQTKLRRRGQALLHRLREIEEEPASALPATPDEDLE